VAVCGISQGGALPLAAAALQPQLVKVCQPDVPFLCDIHRGVGLSPTYPYLIEQQVDLVPAAMNTLAYVDNALLARRITADCLLSVGLMDETCPLSTVFAAYNEISAPRRSSFTRSACTTFRVRMWSGACATCARLLPEADR
jgi:cephalosporin-C deacetylase